MNALFLLAQAEPGRVVFEFSRWEALAGWQIGLLMLSCVAILAYIIFMYRRDSAELPAGIGVLLVMLRVLAFAGLLVFFLGPEKRTEKKLVNPSRALLLVDTSQSMGLQDTDSTAVPAPPSRIDQVVAALGEGKLVEQLREQHDVVVYRFDQLSAPVELATYRRKSNTARDLLRLTTQHEEDQIASFRGTAVAGGILLGLSLLLTIAYLAMKNNARQTAAWLLVAGVGSLAAGVIVLGVGNLLYPEISWRQVAGLPPAEVKEKTKQKTPAEEDAEKDPEINWSEALLPRGAETRIGDALRFLVNKERGAPIAGIAVFSDGNNNAGLEAIAAARAAKDASIPVFTVGLGSDKRPVNVRVVDLEAPPRVFPGDKFPLKGFIQAYGLQGRTVKVEMVSSSTTGDLKGVEALEDERRITLGEDGDVIPVEFKAEPTEEGRRQYTLRIVAPEQDLDARDNEKSAQVQVVERKNKVLLIAGGPMREYRFLRNMLFRDEGTECHVLLQTGQSGISQEANDILFDLPRTADDLFDYDCIVAFDPDWRAFDAEQINLIERWVAEKAGGLIVIAGPVHTPAWTGMRQPDERIRTISGLYPVSFFSLGSATLRIGRFGATEPWPIDFSTAGKEAEFLWLEDDSDDSAAAWKDFEGVYGYYAVKDPKPAATIYAHFSDPDTAIDGEFPIYMAGHFYGAGRVFFQASGEMWRMRGIDTRFFEKYYTKLIRWASQGRLLRDSSRGILLTDRDRYLLGDHVTVRAILTDSQHNPLTDLQVPAVLVQPDSTRTALTLRKLEQSAREGMYSADFTTLQEGDYRIEMQVPQSDSEILMREIRVRVPDLEVEKPERNDPLLKDIAEKTDGTYYIGVEPATRSEGSLPPLTSVMVPQDQETYLPGTPDKKFDELLMTWLLGLICGVLCLEWLIRRLSKLA